MALGPFRRNGFEGNTSGGEGTADPSAIVVRPKRRAQAHSDAEIRKMQSLARGGAPDRLPGASCELHVRDRRGEFVKEDEVIPRGRAANNDRGQNKHDLIQTRSHLGVAGAA
nr:hypothetical protein GCM10017547_42190 [Pseudarthrobacter oxydans]